MQGGFGFPTMSQSKNEYKADTSKKKQELINILHHEEKLWNEGNVEKSQIQLRKAINILKFVVRNQSVQEVRDTYEEKLRELRERYKERENYEQVPQSKLKNNKAYNNTTNVTKNKGNNLKPTGNDKESLQLKGQLADAIVTQKPNVKWGDVSGLQNAKNALKQAVVMPIRFPQIFTGSRKPWKGILLYGPPGTGKTYLAKACATEAQGTFFSVSSSDLMSKYVGESEKLIKNLFSFAREKKPSIIFIDEVDSMCGNRSDGQNEASRRVKTQFLVQMQGVGHDDKGILVLGATNLPWALDPAIRRRFDRRIYIALPEFQARLKMLKHNMRDNQNNLTEADYQDFAKRTQNYSGSDLAILVRDAVYEPVRRLQSATKFKKVGDKYFPCRKEEDGEPGDWMSFPKEQVSIGIVEKGDFEDALKRTKPSVDQKQLQDYEDFTEAFGQDG